jgi:hypothetical protein
MYVSRFNSSAGCRSCVSSELMLGDPEFIKQIERMQKNHIMEKELTIKQKQLARIFDEIS